MTAEPDGRAPGNAKPRALQASPADLGAFLFAPAWVEADGMILTTLSALARAGLDPWDEARRLAAMQRPDAAVILGRSLATLPDAPVPLPRARIIAARLVALLPASGKPGLPVPAHPEQPNRRAIQHRAIVLAVASVAAGLALLLTARLAVPDQVAMAGPPLAAAAEAR